jgi:hypothetical protein
VNSLFLVAGFGLLIVSGPTQAPAPSPPRGGPGLEAAKMIDAYIVSNLQESLGLSDEQFVKLLPLVRHLQSERRDFVQRRNKTVRELRRLLNSGTATEPQVLDSLRELKALESDGPWKIQKSLEAIDAALSPLQQAKFRVLEIEVEQKIRELMNQIRRQGPPADRPSRDRPAQDP